MTSALARLALCSEGEAGGRAPSRPGTSSSLHDRGATASGHLSYCRGEGRRAVAGGSATK